MNILVEWSKKIKRGGLVKVTYVKAFNDNYIWVLEANGRAVVVDPGEAAGVLAYLAAEGLELVGLLLTHKHDDHVGGVAEVVAQFPDVAIYGPSEVASMVTVVVAEGDHFELLGQSFEVLKSAGHTEEHVSFLTEGLLFCGDALFSGGCGRVFTGDYAAAYRGLRKFRALDDAVAVFAGLEYTETNLKFARSVDGLSDGVDRLLKATLETVQGLRAEGLASLPTTIGRERGINLFMMADSLDEFIDLRQARDQF